MSFDDWKATFLVHAERHGVAPAILAHIAPLLHPLPGVRQADATQPEARKTLGQYLGIAVSPARIDTGRRLLVEHKPTFDAIQSRHGVDPTIIAAIWGLETNYGQIRGDVPVFSALATLAHHGRRRALFEDQLLAACTMVNRGINPAQMKGSWAGAMGHTQFMPRSYLDYAVSPSGDMPDIWGDDPADALWSTAQYLSAHGWVMDVPYAVEVDWPQGADLSYLRHHPGQSPADWAALGVVPKPNKPLSETVFRFHMPAGHRNPAFLVSSNYDGLLAYNNADAYAIGVGYLAHRLGGGDAFVTPWSGDTSGLTQAETQQAQRCLTTLGHDTYGADGFVGPNTVKAIEAFQTRHGLAVDGHLDQTLYSHLKRITP